VRERKEREIMMDDGGGVQRIWRERRGPRARTRRRVRWRQYVMEMDLRIYSFVSCR